MKFVRSRVFAITTLIIMVAATLSTALVVRNRTGVSSRAAGIVNITIDAAQTYQTIQGFGASSRLFDDPHVFDNFNANTGRAATTMTVAQQNEILDRLYGEAGLRLTRIRPVSPDSAPGFGIEPVNDNSNPDSADLSKFNFSWKNLDDHCIHIAQARQRGVDTYFLSPLNREAWMAVSSQNDAAEYAEWLLMQVKRCADLGVRLPYLSVANEPSYNRNTMSGVFIRDVIKAVGPRLRSEGFDTKIVLADDLNPAETVAVARTVMADSAARGYVGAIATHLYGGGSGQDALKSLGKQYNVPVWMTEWFRKSPLEWADTMHSMLADFDMSAVDYMWGFFGQWKLATGSNLITLNHDGSRYTGFTLSKTYYMMGQYSRYVRPGARRIAASSSDAGAKVSAYLNGSELVIVAVNSTSDTRNITMMLKNLGGISRLSRIRTSASENWNVLPELTLNGTAFEAVLPPSSVTTYVASVIAPPPPSNNPSPTAQLTAVPSPTTPPPGTTTLSLNLLLHGLGKGGDNVNPQGLGNNNPKRTQRTIETIVSNSQNQVVQTKQGTVTYNSSSGSFKGVVGLDNNLSSGTYTVKVKTDQFLRTLIPGIQTLTKNAVNSLPTATLITGDINGDNAINIVDYNILIGCYSDLTPATFCTAQNKLRADLTDDGNINQTDYNLFLRELTNIAGNR